MKIQKIRTAGILLVGLLVVTGLKAQPPRYERMAHFNVPDLSEEQKDEINTIRMEHFQKIKPLRNKMAELKAKENTLMSEEEVDLKAVNKVIDEQTDLINKMRKLQAEQKVKIKSTLTEEQIMKFEQRRALKKHRRTNGYDMNRAPNRGRPHHRNVG
jgi:Spy/CpxP family protein refolding chaperone